MKKASPLERLLYARGLRLIAGVDEAGRGCLAGPVFAGSVILPPGLVLPEVDDSKKLAAAERERLELDAKAREADAAARIAEADARRAEAEAQDPYGVSGGIPYPWIFLGSGPIVHPGPGCARPRPPTRASVPPRTPVVQPPPRQPPAPATAPVARGALVVK